jgi:hypothetical protein
MPTVSERVLVLVGAARLDDDLAAGVPPETSRRHAARARQLVNPQMRHVLATNWEHLLAITHAPPRRLSGRAPICRQRVRQAEPEIRELIMALRASGPMPVRGVATATSLLTDGCGPIFNPNAPDDLTATVARAVGELDPAQPLTLDLVRLVRRSQL